MPARWVSDSQNFGHINAYKALLMSDKHNRKIIPISLLDCYSSYQFLWLLTALLSKLHKQGSVFVQEDYHWKNVGDVGR